MKTTIEIHDDLLARAKQYARKTGRPLYAIVEEGLRQVLPETPFQQSLPSAQPERREARRGRSIKSVLLAGTARDNLRRSRRAVMKIRNPFEPSGIVETKEKNTP